jgi:hypothetical protein
VIIIGLYGHLSQNERKTLPSEDIWIAQSADYALHACVVEFVHVVYSSIYLNCVYIKCTAWSHFIINFYYSV